MAGDVAGGVLNPATRQGSLLPAESRVGPPTAQPFPTRSYQISERSRRHHRSLVSSGEETSLPSRGEDFGSFGLLRENRGFSDSDARSKNLAPWGRRVPQDTVPKPMTHNYYPPSWGLLPPLPLAPGAAPGAISGRMPLPIAPRSLHDAPDGARSALQDPPKTPQDPSHDRFS